MRLATSDSAVAILARRLVPAALIVPAALALLYDAEVDRLWLIAGNTAVFIAMSWWIAAAVVRAESRRRAAEQTVQTRDAYHTVESAGHHDQLEQRVRERTAELQAVNEQLEAFSYSVAHDLRAPLRSISSFSQALHDDYADRLGPEGLDHIGHIRKSAQRMADLIDDLLGFSRLSRAELRRQRVDVSAMTRGILAHLRSTQPERDVDILVEDGLIAQADPRLLDIVLTNLVGNAWKFTGKREHALIELGARPGDPMTYFVRDNGAGFEPSAAGRLFGVFQRLHAAHEFDGTGIGLATVQRLIHRHGGKVWAEGEVDRGATVYFTLEPGRHQA